MKICPPGSANALTVRRSASRWKSNWYGARRATELVDETLPDASDELDVRGTPVESPVLLRHPGRGLQAERDLLVGRQRDALLLAGGRG